jgi:hypothetical protein
MPARGLSDAVVVVTAAVAIVLLAAAASLMSPAPTRGDDRGSSYSAAADGAKGAFLTLKQLGYRVERSFEPITALPANPWTITLVLASPSIDPSAQDKHALRRFIERGGVVLATGSAGARFLGALTGGPGGGRPATAEPFLRTGVSPLSAGAPQIRMAPETEAAGFDDGYLAVYGTERDAAVRTARIGRGQAIWWSGSTPLSNTAIAQPGHLELLLNAVGDPSSRAVLWDERYHGHARSLWSYAAATPLPWVALQFGLIAAVLLATFARRWTPVRPRVVEPRTSPMEFVETMGALYEQGGAAPAAVASARRRLRRLLVAASGVPPDSADIALARASGARLGLDPDRISALLASSAGLGHSADECLPLVRALQTMTEAIAAARGAGGSARLR